MNTSTAAAIAADDDTPMTDAEREAGISIMTAPETQIRQATIMGKPVELAPLKIKKQRMLLTRCDDALKFLREKGAEAPLLEVVNPISTALTKSYAYLAQVYGIQNCDEDWIEDNLDSGEVLALVNAQVEVQSEHDYLLTGLLAILSAATAARAQANSDARALRAAISLNSAKQESTSPSAKPGTAPSINSSKGTPGGS